MSGLEFVEDVKERNKKVGKIYKKDDKFLFVNRMSSKYILFRNEKSVSDAVRNNTAQIGLKYDLLLRVKAKKIGYIAVVIKETGDMYITTIENFFSSESSYRYGYQYLPITAFRCAVGKVKI